MTGGKALPKEISDQIVSRTDGVPLFIEELTKTVLESGIVTEAGDHYAVTGSVAPLAIPTSLHASLLARLDRLAPTRDVVQIAAALGRQFSHELISAVAELPQQRLDDALAQLLNAELYSDAGCRPMQSTPSSTLWYKTPPIARYCAAVGSSCTPASPQSWKANSQTLSKPTRK